MPGEEKASITAGMEGYLAKPVRANALFEIIQRISVPRKAIAPGEPSAEVIFDRLRLLERLEGDEELAGEIIGMFLQECPKLLDQVRQAAEQRSAPSLERAAHALKGSLGDIGAHQAFGAARTLEMAARDGKIDGADTALASLVAAVDRLLPELHRIEKKAE
jgi:HPt (histidine-containing phosphotransfer) domain-containing protein